MYYGYGELSGPILSQSECGASGSEPSLSGGLGPLGRFPPYKDGLSPTEACYKYRLRCKGSSFVLYISNSVFLGARGAFFVSP